MSPSTMPTPNSVLAMATARLTVTVDFPTPPLPLLIAIMQRGMAASFGDFAAVVIMMVFLQVPN